MKKATLLAAGATVEYFAKGELKTAVVAKVTEKMAFLDNGKRMKRGDVKAI